MIIGKLYGQYSLSNQVLNQSILIDFQIVQQIEVDQSDQNYLTFGIWSKYNPLANVKLKGAYGLFDSNCFQILNSVDYTTSSLNFIYYDCIYDTTKEIKKFIQFGFSQTEQFIFSLQIEHSEYEDFWYFFQIITNIQKKSVELRIYFQINQIFQEILQLSLPNKDQQLLFTFGGSLKVENSNIELIKQGTIFSLYPGQLILYNKEMQRIPQDYDFRLQFTEFYKEIEICACVIDYDIAKSNVHLLLLDQQTKVLQNMNCNSYVLAGWLQISQVHQDSEQFVYQFMKISTNVDGIQDENLATFQFFYQISPVQNKIIITTYKYNFPSVTQDFWSNPFIIRRELLIQNAITSWQYIYVNLQENVLDFSIIFYEAQNTQSYETSIDVKQFHNYQLKITYGNIQQTKLDYLDVIVRDLLFINCVQDLKQQKCHYSCQECDGPTKYNCLTCSAESKRIFIPESKQCTCQLGTIDYDNQCIDYVDQNLQLNLQFNVKQTRKLNCKMGYFEFDGECMKCPQGIYKDFLICRDCFQNVETWSLNPVCTEVLDVTSIFGQYEKPKIDNFYFYDSSDLISTKTHQDKIEIIGMQDEFQLFENFRQSSQIFFSLCNARGSMYDQQLCYPCTINYCQSCGFTINNDIFCLKCDDQHKLVDGSCNIYEYFNYASCLPPYYASFSRECKLCTLENCLYCFEFTLVSELEISIEFDNLYDSHAEFAIGCMLCEKDYNFNFNFGRCLKKAPSMINCLASVTKPTNEEICLTSSLDNFQVSREINRCDSLITNCSLCFLDNNNKLTCLACESNYVLFSGICYEGDEQSASYSKQFWSLKVTSFLTNFYQNYNYEQPPELNPCGDQCVTCKLSLGEYYCEKCFQVDLNPFLKRINQMCKYCSALCQICDERFEFEIKKTAPFLQTTYLRTPYTTNCIFPLIDPFINYNPYLQTTQYCLEGDCNNELTYEYIERLCFFDRFPKYLDDLGIQAEYLNTIGVVSMTIIIRIEIQDEYCVLMPSLVTTATLKFQVFTLQVIHLKLLATYPFFLEIPSQTFIQEYDSFTMIDYGIVFPYLNNYDLNISNSYNEVNFTLINVTIKNSLIQNAQSLFKTKNFGYVELQNLSIINTQFINSSLFNFNAFSLIGSIRINQLYLLNCNFTNSILFEFSYVQFPIQFINLTLDKCSLQNSSIFKFFANNPLDIQIYLASVSIFRSNFNNSYFFYCSQQVDVIANNLVFNFNQLLDSIIFGFSSGLESTYIQINNNIFIESSFMSTIQMISQQFVSCNLMYLKIRNNKFQNSNLFRFFSQFQSSDLLIRLDNVLIEYNEGLITLNQVSYLFNINGKTIILNHFSIYQTKNVYILYFFDSQNIELENFVFENSEIEEKVSVSINCLLNQNFQNQIISIIGFNTVSLSNFKIHSIQSMDQSIIKIMSSNQYFQEQTGQVTIINVEFNGNLLQSLNEIIYFSLLTLISDRTLDILIKNVVFQNNIMHTYNQNSLKDSAALLYISTFSSIILIENLQCKYNAMTNSSNSFIYVDSKSLKMNNIQVRFHNILPLNIWNNYYNLIQVSQDQIQSLIKQIYQIKTIGGAAYIQTSNFICINSSFAEIMAAKISVFEIVTSSDGTIEMQNLSILQIRNSVQENVESAGCLSINAINSFLNLQIKNARFQNIQNRMSSSIITINPSLLKNKLIFQNMSIIDCVSLKNQIVKIQFISQANKQHSISFIDLMIFQSQESWVNLFQNIGILSDSEILEITGKDNAIINLESCDVTIKNLIFEGMLFSSVIILNNINTLNMVNCHFYYVQNVYTQNIIVISQTVQQKYYVSLRSFIFQNGSMYFAYNFPNQEYIQIQTTYFFSGCSIQSFSVQSLQKNYFYSNMIQLLKQNQQQTSILYVRSQSNLGVFIFDKIKFTNNNYSASQQGIIHFDDINFKKFQIIRFDCHSNIINKYGCLNIIGNQNASNVLEIKNSNFISNLGTQGIAIKSSDILLNLIQCNIISNIALSQGGGLYLQLFTKKFFISKTIIICNKAQEGGGIYFDLDNDLSIKTQVQTFIYFNQAEIYGNNLVENPSYLSLYINSKAMAAVESTINNISTSILRINPYVVMEQGIRKQTEMLMIPSTQIIDTYQIFFVKKAQYLTYIKSLNIYFKNSKGELLHNIYNSTCVVSDYIVTKGQDDKQKSSSNQLLQFQAENNNFELTTLSFRLDPYLKENRHLEIQIFCQTQQSQNGLNYIINAKSFKCQLGEFYIEEGCQTCKSSQGFYSVTYDAIKCSVFDKTKFQNITSNMINLQKGYWRPNYLSDASEKCYKNTEVCLGGWQVGDSTCSQGHIGALCEMCDLYNIRGQGQFFKNQQNVYCVSCSNEESSILPFVFALIQAILSISLSLKSINKSNSLFNQLTVFQKTFSKILFTFNQDHEGILIKILLNYLWIFSSIFTFNLRFSFSIFFIEQSSNSFYFMVNNLDCYLSDLSMHLIYAQIIFILLLMLLQFYVTLIISFIYYQLSSQQMERSIISNTLLCLYVFNYGGLIKLLCSKLSVRQISNIDYIQGDVSLLFDSQEHYLWIYFLIIPLLLIFGCIIPFSLFLLMFRNRFRLFKLKFRKHICYLFNEYNEKQYFWEQIKLIQKTFIILVITNFENNVLLKTTLLGICLEIYQVLANNSKPYIISKFNNLDLESGQICLIAIFLAATKYETQVLQNDFFSMLLQIILIILLCRLGLPFIKEIVIIYSKKYSLPILTKFHPALKQSNIKLFKFIGMQLDQELEKRKKLQMNIQKIRFFLQTKFGRGKEVIFFTKRTILKSNTNSKASFIEINNQLQI
ncbi:unnamed protein product [Paramecium octaurelia]|uniref:Transmembrane protein n=1 Tax=Paramecium octaurelia TaxID=43137 RepID=A0A8S1UZ93_PAROT|nr:unnamed protein product [Paramecium octaurelia]